MLVRLAVFSSVVLINTIGCSGSNFSEGASGLSDESAAAQYNSTLGTNKQAAANWNRIVNDKAEIDSDGIFTLFTSPKKPKIGEDYYLVITVDKSNAPNLQRSHIHGFIDGNGDTFYRKISKFQKYDEGFINQKSKLSIIIPMYSPANSVVSDYVEISATGAAWATGKMRVRFRN